MSETIITNIKTMFSAAAAAKAEGKATWFEVIFPDMTNAFFISADPGREIPLPDIGQNEAATLPISMVINKYVGLETKVEPS